MENLNDVLEQGALILAAEDCSPELLKVSINFQIMRKALFVALSHTALFYSREVVEVARVHY
jgi:hypothetical protein